MVSRTSAASFSAPLRKSTGLVATITRTAPVGPITCRLSMHAAPPSKSLRPRHGRPGLSRRDLDLDRSGTGFGFAIRRPPLLNRKRFPHPQLPARTATCQPQNVQPQILAIDVASQTTAAAITMASSYRTDRVSARRDPGDNPGLVFIAPCPPPGSGEHFQPADWFRDSSMYSVYSKPNGQNQTADSQISTSSGR
jgi:hypothetical protein